MEKNAKAKPEHNLMLINRIAMTLSGVSEVVSVTDKQIVLKTSCGDLSINGNALNIGKLNTDSGELVISGTVDYIRYSKKKGGLFEGLFK